MAFPHCQFQRKVLEVSFNLLPKRESPPPKDKEVTIDDVEEALQMETPMLGDGDQAEPEVPLPGEEDEGDLSAFLSQGFYEALGVDPSVNKATLTKAYKQLCLVHHPDKGGLPAKFLFLKFAYDVLHNDASREM